jgi:hypothetical protein
MKALLYTVSIVFILAMKVELIALAIASVLWLIGLFGVTGGDVLRLIGLNSWHIRSIISGVCECRTQKVGGAYEQI